MTQFYSLTPGKDTLKGIANDDNAFQLEPGTLQSTDAITGGAAGYFLDLIILTSSGVISATQFSSTSGIEELILAPGGSSVTLIDGLVAGTSIGYFAIADDDGDDTVDASAISTTPVVFFASGGSDRIEGGHGNDAIVIAPANLSSADTINGGGGIDNLYLSSAGTVGPTAFAHVSGIEGLVLASGANTITLTDGLIGQTSIGYFAVATGAGDDMVDASHVTNAVAVAFYGTGGGNDSFSGGNGNDAFLFAPGQLTASDVVNGGSGSDTLWMVAPGTTTAADLAHVTGIEGVLLQNGGTFHFANGITDSTGFAAVGSIAADTFDASAVTDYGVTFAGNGGVDTLIGGAGDDVFRLTDAAFASIDGHAGADRILITNQNPSFDLSASAARLHSIEVISFEGVDHGSLTMTGLDIASVSGNNALYIVGDHLDAFDAGTGYTQISSGISNDAVAPDHTFYEFRHSSGSTLFVDTLIYGTSTTDGPVGIEPENSPTSHVVYSDQSIYPQGTTVTHALFGPDAALFDIDPSTGDVTFKVSPDFENPLDQGHNNHYDFSVAISTDRAIPVTFQVSGAIVTDVNDNAPVFTSGVSASTPEEVATTTSVYTAAGTDADGTAANRAITYSLPTGLNDNDLFSIDGSGHVSFKTSPNYEAPIDADHDNNYEIVVLASDGLDAHDASLNVVITVNDFLLL